MVLVLFSILSVAFCQYFNVDKAIPPSADMQEICEILSGNNKTILEGLCYMNDVLESWCCEDHHATCPQIICQDSGEFAKACCKDVVFFRIA